RRARGGGSRRPLRVRPDRGDARGARAHVRPRPAAGPGGGGAVARAQGRTRSLGERRVRGAAGGFELEQRVLPIPALTADDEAALEQGQLPARGAVGTAVGALARNLAGLEVGVALGAGSLRGYAHVGALRAFERHGIPVDYLAGTSIGAIVAALYARFGDLDRVADFLDGLGARMFRPT